MHQIDAEAMTNALISKKINKLGFSGAANEVRSTQRHHTSISPIILLGLQASLPTENSIQPAIECAGVPSTTHYAFR